MTSAPFSSFVEGILARDKQESVALSVPNESIVSGACWRATMSIGAAAMSRAGHTVFEANSGTLKNASVGYCFSLCLLTTLAAHVATEGEEIDVRTLGPRFLNMFYIAGETNQVAIGIRGTRLFISLAESSNPAARAWWTSLDNTTKVWLLAPVEASDALLSDAWSELYAELHGFSDDA